MMNKFLFSALFLFSFGVQANPEIAIASTIEVSPRSSINAFDVVEAKNMSDSIAEDLKEVVLSAEGKNETLSKSDLAKLLRGVKARFVLPSEMKLLRSRNAISRMEVERKIKNKIYSDCNACEVQVVVSNIPQNLLSDWDLDLNIDLSKKTVMIPIYSTSNASLKNWIVAEIKRYQKVPVLNQSVKFGEVLAPEMFIFEKREISNVRNTFQSLESLEGMQASRFLNAGQVVQFSDVKREQVLKRGQMVKAIVGNNSFEVIISAEAQEAGSVGETIKVKNLDSQRVFAGKIVERGVVRIE
jgi:flagellar basal body P-ring formation protein FlgA